MTVFKTTPTNIQILAGLEAANDPVFDTTAIAKLKTYGKKVVYVGEREEIMAESYYRRLWMAVSNLNIPRRQWPDKISIDIANFDGAILHSDGRPFQFPELDEVFGDDIWEMRWFSGYIKADEAGTRPAAVSRAWRKVQLIDLSLRIAQPSLAKHFSK